MNNTATGLAKLIKDKRMQLEKILAQEAELVSLQQGKLKQLQDAVASKPKVEQQLNALEMSLAIAEDREDMPEEHIVWQVGGSVYADQTAPPSNADVVEEILRQAGKPLLANELLGLLAARGKKVSKKTLTSGIYGWVKRGKRFRLFGPGRFGLIEWRTLREG